MPRYKYKTAILRKYFQTGKMSDRDQRIFDCAMPPLRVMCPCGTTYREDNLRLHKKTTGHKLWKRVINAT